MSKINFDELEAALKGTLNKNPAKNVEEPVLPEVPEIQVDIPDGHEPFSKVFGYDPTEYIGFDVPVRVYQGRENVPAKDTEYVWPKAELASFAFAKYMGFKTALFGWPGTGKSTLSEQFAAWTGKSYYRENMTTSMEPDELLGRWRILSKDGVSVTEFVPTDFVRAIQEPYEVCIDEVFAARPALLQALQRMFEEGGVLRIPDGDVTITPHPECTFTLTDNTKGDGDNLDKFASRNVQDSSLMNRIELSLNIHYLSTADEEALVAKWAPSLQRALVEKLVQVANLVRTAYEKGEMSKTFSPRQLKTVARTIALTRKPKESLQLCFGNMLQNDEAAAFDNMVSTVRF